MAIASLVAAIPQVLAGIKQQYKSDPAFTEPVVGKYNNKTAGGAYQGKSVLDLDQTNLEQELRDYGAAGGNINLADFRRLVTKGHDEDTLGKAVVAAANLNGLSIGGQLGKYFETGKVPDLPKFPGFKDLRGTPFQDAFAALTKETEDKYVVRDPDTGEYLGMTEDAGVKPLPGKTVNIYDPTKTNVVGTMRGMGAGEDPVYTPIGGDEDSDVDDTEDTVTEDTVSADTDTTTTTATTATTAEADSGFDVEAFLNKQAETLAARDAAAAARLEKAMAANQLMIQNFLKAQDRMTEQREVAEKVTMANMARASQLANLKIGTSAKRGTSGIDAFKRRLKITPTTSIGLALAGGTQSTNKMLNV